MPKDQVVFTGAAKIDGNWIPRYCLEDRCSVVGLEVASKVTKDTAYLIASRTDTKKAQEALKLGVDVMVYEDFFDLLEDLEDAADTPH